MSNKILPICKWCGSDSIWSDATATWNVNAQCWELDDTQDYTGCSYCDEATYFEVEDSSDTYPPGTRKAVLVQGFADGNDGAYRGTWNGSPTSAVIEDPETGECFVVWELDDKLTAVEQLPLQSIQVLEKVNEYVWRKVSEEAGATR